MQYLFQQKTENSQASNAPNLNPAQFYQIASLSTQKHNRSRIKLKKPKERLRNTIVILPHEPGKPQEKSNSANNTGGLHVGHLVSSYKIRPRIHRPLLICLSKISTSRTHNASHKSPNETIQPKIRKKTTNHRPGHYKWRSLSTAICRHGFRQRIRIFLICKPKRRLGRHHNTAALPRTLRLKENNKRDRQPSRRYFHNY